MSQYHTAQTEFTDKESLVEALENMGWKVEKHDNPIEISSGYGAKKKAHVVVRRNQFSGAADIGFEKQKDKWVLHRDHVDDHKINDNIIKARYAESRVNKSIKGRSKYRKVSRQENDDEIRIRIRTTI
tara:strand:+ start:65965 stop:66348 length:384 start_codon:yes stop_codon:yes gene_type:complete